MPDEDTYKGIIPARGLKQDDDFDTFLQIYQLLIRA